MTVLITRTLGSVAIDCVLSENHTSTIAMTSLPVERGADITDHAYAEPKTLTLDGVAGRRLGDTQSTFVNPSDSYQALLRMQESVEPFDIQTGLYLYRNMLIKRISTTRSSDDADILRFTAELQEVIIAGVSYVDSVEAPATGQVPTLQESTLQGTARERAAPTAQRGDNVVYTVDYRMDTASSRRRLEMMQRVGAIA